MSDFGKIANLVTSRSRKNSASSCRDHNAVDPALTSEQRRTIVKRVAKLVVELRYANGDSSIDGDVYRQQLMARLRGLAISLWRTGGFDI